MKISNDFVTNSSSTSFIISSKDGLTKENLLRAFGVSEESLLFDLYSNLYYALKKNSIAVPDGIEIRDYLSSKGIKIDDEEDLAEIEKRYLNGEMVFCGELDNSGDTGGMAEAFFTHESFIIVGDDFYFNARNSIF